MSFVFTGRFLGLLILGLFGTFFSAYMISFSGGAESATDTGSSIIKDDFRIAQSGSGSNVSNEDEPTVNETYKDWTVLCHDYTIGGQTENRCRIQQVVVEKGGSKRQLLYMTLFKGVGDSFSTGLIRTPLGIILPNGVEMRIDDGQYYNFPYNHCLPRGCIARVSFKESDISLLRQGSKLQTLMLSIDRKKYAIDISLLGFSDAFNRLAELTE